MNDIDNIFKATLAKIKDEETKAIEENEKQKKVDRRFKKIVTLALHNPSGIATKAFQSDSDFSSFMIEKSCRDPYAPWMARMIITNFPIHDIVLDPQDKKLFRIHVVVETNRGQLATIADFKSFDVSCGHWWFCRGLLRVVEEVPADSRLLHFINNIDSVEKFIETCTRSNTQ